MRYSRFGGLALALALPLFLACDGADPLAPPLAFSESCDAMEIPEPDCDDGGGGGATAPDYAQVSAITGYTSYFSGVIIQVHATSSRYSSVQLMVGTAGDSEVVTASKQFNGQNPLGIPIGVDEVCAVADRFGNVKITFQMWGTPTYVSDRGTQYLHVSEIDKGSFGFGGAGGNPCEPDPDDDPWS